MWLYAESSSSSSMMTMRMLHAVAAVLTVILLFIRHRCAITAGTCPSQSKRRRFPVCPCSFGDSSLTDMPLLPEDCMVCARSACFYEECGQPKYKRDPDIRVDNENIGQHPHD